MRLVTNELELRAELLKATCRKHLVEVQLGRWLELPSWLPKWTGAFVTDHGLSWCATSRGRNRLLDPVRVMSARAGFTTMCSAVDIVGVSFELYAYDFPFSPQQTIAVSYSIDLINVPGYLCDLLGAEVRA